MRLRDMALAAALLVGSLQAASADVIFNLSGVILSSLPSGGTSEGTLTGTFTASDALNAITSYDITASAFGSFAGFEFTAADSKVSASVLPSQYFQIDSTGPDDYELRIYFTSALTSSGAGISSTYSYESEVLSGGNRFPSGSISGSVVVTGTSKVPEPASLALLGAGLLGLKTLRRRRRA